MFLGECLLLIDPFKSTRLMRSEIIDFLLGLENNHQPFSMI